MSLPQNFNGIVQRLVQKEKEVLLLKSDLEKYKAQNPSEGRDAVRDMIPYWFQLTVRRTSAQSVSEID